MPPERDASRGPSTGTGLSRQDSYSAASAAAAAAGPGKGTRPALKVIASQPAIGGTRRAWVKRRGAAQATSIIVDAEELVDDFKIKILQRYPTTLLRDCDPADLRIFLPEGVEKTLRNGYSPGARSRRSGTQSAGPTLFHAPELDSGHTGAPRRSPAASPLAPRIELQPEEPLVPIFDRYFPHGMTKFEAFELDVRHDGLHQPILAPTGAKEIAALDRSLSAERVPAPEQSTLKPPRQNVPDRPGNPRRTSSTQHSANLREGSSTSTSTSSAPAATGIANGTRRTSAGSKFQETKANSNILLLPRHLRISDARSAQGDVPVIEDREDASPAIEMPEGATKDSQDEEARARLTQFSRAALASTDGSPVVPQVNVLIVEDNVINQRILEAFMHRKKVRFGVARNGKEAVEKWRQGGYHLILMDIQLPVMTGLEATKEIRRLECANRIGAFSSSEAVAHPPRPPDVLNRKEIKSPIIIVALTASSASEDQSEALAAGCNDFLTKPVNLRWLEQKLLEWGCMQALIDFDGWRHWIRKDLDRPQEQEKALSVDTSAAQHSLPAIPGSPHSERGRSLHSPRSPSLASPQSPSAASVRSPRKSRSRSRSKTAKLSRVRSRSKPVAERRRTSGSLDSFQDAPSSLNELHHLKG